MVVVLGDDIGKKSRPCTELMFYYILLPNAQLNHYACLPLKAFSTPSRKPCFSQGRSSCPWGHVSVG